MFHASVYLSICGSCVALTALLRLDNDAVGLAWIAALAIGVLGVPHGGLDHWAGKRLLQPRIKRYWSLAFFPVYLAVGLGVAAGWALFPVVTVIVFFLMSAWHFGREESDRSSTSAPSHLMDLASGGLIIWTPMLFRSAETQQLLTHVCGGDGEAAAVIVALTRPIATVMLCLVLMFWAKLCRDRKWQQLSIGLGTFVVAWSTPILVSFTVYFCLWHSVLGLQHLRANEGLSWRSFLVHVAPLSIAAIVGTFVMGHYVGIVSIDALSRSNLLHLSFLGLASIAVPHVIMHEVIVDRYLPESNCDQDDSASVRGAVA
ncbi:MAG: Brp/Blh family beta-carotene 15,15'-dioxygenase [Planctomycetota bacterium]